MPNLNLKDDEVVHEEPMAPRLRRRDDGSQSKTMIVILYIVLILIVLGAAAFFLDKAGIIKLWGSKPTAVKRIMPPAPAIDSLAAEEAAAAAAKPEAGKAAGKTESGKKAKGSAKTAATPKETKAAPAPKETKPAKVAVPVQPAGSGEFAVQISSWPEEEKAVAHANQLRESGLDAYVVKAGERWTVRVGRYPTQQAAKEEAARLGENAESRVIVVKAQ